MLYVVSAGGIHAHPAAERSGRSRLHPASAGSPGPNHTITRPENTPRSLRSAKEPEPPSLAPAPALALALSREPPRSPRLRVSPYCSASPRSMRAIVKGRAPPGRTPSLFSFGDQPRSLIGPRAFRGRGRGVLLARRRSLLPHRSSLVRASGSRGPTASADRILKANHGSIRDSALSRPDACSGSA